MVYYYSNRVEINKLYNTIIKIERDKTNEKVS